MKTIEFDYSLPDELIAQTPIINRDSSRMLVLNRRNGKVTHKYFTDILDYVRPGDVFVVNDTKVIPARLFGRRETGGRAEVLLLKPVGNDIWECLVRPGRKLNYGNKILIGDNEAIELVGEIKERTAYGGRLIRWIYHDDWQRLIERVGRIPLPPYIKRPLSDPKRYQTIFAKVPGSAAAPTAGLHFTQELINALKANQVTMIPITLNVGLDTFRPVTEQNVLDHKMHSESYEITESAAMEINDAKKSGRRIFAIGTTVVRTLESSYKNGSVRAGSNTTDLFIYPGYRFNVVDCMITNFHLPKSTLLMLVSAFAQRQFIMNAYQEAINARYRFFSFGDAMLIL